MTRRKRNWDLKLLSWQMDVVGSPFSWGQTDCASLVLGALDAMYDEPPVTHDDIADYQNKTGALRVLHEIEDIVEFCKDHGAEEVDYHFAQSGDLIFGRPDDEAEDDDFPGLAVVVDHGAVVTHPGKTVQRRNLRRFSPDVTLLRFPNE